MADDIVNTNAYLANQMASTIQQYLNYANTDIVIYTTPPDGGPFGNGYVQFRTVTNGTVWQPSYPTLVNTVVGPAAISNAASNAAIEANNEAQIANTNANIANSSSWVAEQNSQFWAVGAFGSNTGANVANAGANVANANAWAANNAVYELIFNNGNGVFTANTLAWVAEGLATNAAIEADIANTHAWEAAEDADAANAGAQAANAAVWDLVSNSGSGILFANASAWQAEGNAVNAATLAIIANTNSWVAEINSVTANTDAQIANTNAWLAEINVIAANSNVQAANTNVNQAVAFIATTNAAAFAANAMIANTHAWQAEANAVIANTGAWAAYNTFFTTSTIHGPLQITNGVVNIQHAPNGDPTQISLQISQGAVFVGNGSVEIANGNLQIFSQDGVTNGVLDLRTQAGELQFSHIANNLLTGKPSWEIESDGGSGGILIDASSLFTEVNGTYAPFTKQYTFFFTSVSGGNLTIAHNLNNQFPTIIIANSSNAHVTPDGITYTNANSCVVNLSSQTVGGTWHAAATG